MSVEYVQKTVNQLNKELVSLEKKMAALVKNEAEYTKKIGSTQKSINNNTPLSILKSKSKQIENYQKKIADVISEKSKVNKKIADVRKKLSDATLKLQREESIESKKIAKQQEEIYASYEQQISQLTNQINEQLVQNNPMKNFYSSDRSEEFDIFLSHASEDKESFCDEFSKILQEEFGLKVWYDALSIKWGDSIRVEIDRGLKKSKFGIVILSKDYIKKYWTNYELEALFQKESNGGKVILPIWHNITKTEVQDFSPSIAGKLAMTTANMTPNEIAKKLNEILFPHNKIIETHNHD